MPYWPLVCIFHRHVRHVCLSILHVLIFKTKCLFLFNFSLVKRCPFCVLYLCFQTYPDYSGLMLYDFDIPGILYSASLLGIDQRKQAWKEDYYSTTVQVLTFLYFNVPCSEGTFANR